MAELPLDLIAPKLAARIACCHISTIYRLVLSGKLRAYRRAGSRYLISQEAVEGLFTMVEPEGLVMAPRTRTQEARAAEEALGRLRERGFRC